VWVTLKILGFEILDVTVGFADREEPETATDYYISQNGGQFEVAADGEVEWEESEEYDPEYDNRAPFGFRHA